MAWHYIKNLINVSSHGAAEAASESCLNRSQNETNYKMCRHQRPAAVQCYELGVSERNTSRGDGEVKCWLYSHLLGQPSCPPACGSGPGTHLCQSQEESLGCISIGTHISERGLTKDNCEGVSEWVWLADIMVLWMMTYWRKAEMKQGWLEHNAVWARNLREAESCCSAARCAIGWGKWVSLAQLCTVLLASWGIFF